MSFLGSKQLQSANAEKWYAIVKGACKDTLFSDLFFPSCTWFHLLFFLFVPPARVCSEKTRRHAQQTGQKQMSDANEWNLQFLFCLLDMSSYTWCHTFQRFKFGSLVLLAGTETSRPSLTNWIRTRTACWVRTRWSRPSWTVSRWTTGWPGQSRFKLLWPLVDLAPSGSKNANVWQRRCLLQLNSISQKPAWNVSSHVCGLFFAWNGCWQKRKPCLDHYETLMNTWRHFATKRPKLWSQCLHKANAPGLNNISLDDKGCLHVSH